MKFMTKCDELRITIVTDGPFEFRKKYQSVLLTVFYLYNLFASITQCTMLTL